MLTLFSWVTHPDISSRIRFMIKDMKEIYDNEFEEFMSE